MDKDNFLEEIDDFNDIGHAEEIDAAPDSNGCPMSPARRLPGAQAVFTAVTILLACFLALPVLGIYFFKSPLPLQHVYALGISYYNLVFVFLISTAVVMVSLLFFFKSRPGIILTFFLVCLFCCVPLIIGLKNNLTLVQALEQIPFFAEWPFFLNPLYIFVEIVLPAGMLTFLFLQVKHLFSKGPTGYGFLCAAGYLAVAVFTGFTGLIQAGRPNIVTALTQRYELSHEDRLSPLPPEAAPQTATRPTEAVPPPALPEAVPSEYEAPMDQRVQQLEDRLDKISIELEQLRRSRGGPYAAATADTDTGPGVLTDKINHMDESLEKFTQPAPGSSPAAFADVRQKMDMLSDKVDMLISRLNQAVPVPQQRSYAAGKADIDPVGVLDKIELLSDKVDRIAEALDRRGLAGLNEKNRN